MQFGCQGMYCRDGFETHLYISSYFWTASLAYLSSSPHFPQIFENPCVFLNNMKTKKINQYIAVVALISIAISILVHFNTILSYFTPSEQYMPGTRHGETLPNILVEIFVTFLVTFCLFLLNYYVLKPINSSKRLNYKSILFAIFITLLAVTLLSDSFFAIKHFLYSTTHSKSFNLLYTFRDLFIAIVVLCCVFIIRNTYEKQAIRLENERLMRENLQSQYESLKNQVSPHFLFNSLTALKSLINDDTKNALHYLNDLSQVLRYTLQSNINPTVTLAEETDAARSYIFLIKMRFNSNLQVEFNIHERYKYYRLPPLAIQTLLENAVKHNEISKRNPLEITILTRDNESLVVTNTIREKFSPEPGTGIGLSNLAKQYKLLCGKDILISKMNNDFRVEIPLLKPTENEGSNR
jgi:sensor histidine kinase YesM